VVSTLAGSGSNFFADGTGTLAMFKNPFGLAVDGSGNLYIADKNNNAIRKSTTTTVLSGDATGQAGNHSIVLNADDGHNGITSQSFTLTVNSTLGIEDNIIKGFKLYPNPVKDVLTITAQETIKQIKVFNLLGQKVNQKTPNSTQVIIDLSLLPTGTYFVYLTTDKTSKSVKLIKR